MDNYVIVDLETQNHPYYGMVASPFCPDNYIVEMGWKFKEGGVHSHRNSDKEHEHTTPIEQILSKVNVFVAHNATYEIHWMLSRFYEPFMDFLRRGGRVFCTQYAEYLLSRQEELYPKLDEVAPRYGGTHKIDEVKLLWEKGVLTADIDPDILHEYLCSDHGDVINTEKIYLGQLEALKERGMLEMTKLRMDALLFNAFATFFGMHVNMKTAYKNLEIQNKRIEELKNEINDYLPSDLPFDFNFNSDYHLSALIFGGPVEYRCKVSYEPKKYELGDFYEVNGEFIETNKYFGALEFCTRYKSGKNKGMIKVFRRPTNIEKLKWGTQIYHFEGLIDLTVLPVGIQEAFLGDRSDFTGKRTMVDGSPVFSTGTDALTLLKKYLPIADKLLELGALEKDVGTYYLKREVDADGNVLSTRGMLQFVLPSGIIHHNLNNCATRTGRLSSNRPNLQNLPRDGTSKVKEMLDSRFGEQGRVIEVDYTSLEVVALAAISGDQNLIKALVNGTDMHCFRLAFDMRLPYEEVYKYCHDEEHPKHKEFKELRTAIKRKSFAAQYGASAKGIAYSTGCDEKDAQRFLDNEAKLFPEATAFRKIVREKVEITGLQEKKFIRDRDPTGAYYLCRKGYFKANGGTEYSFRQYIKKERGKTITDYKDTEIANYPIQGEGAFIVQCACGRVIRWLIKENFYGNRVLPINTVHDAIYLDVCSDDYAQRTCRAVQWIMETTPKYMCSVIPQYKEWNYNTVPFPAVPEYGNNLYEKKGL